MVSTQTTRSLSYFHESRLEKEKELLAQKKHLSSQAPGNQAPWTDPGYRAWTSDPGQMGLVYLLISIPIGGLLFLGIHAYQQSGHDVKIFPSDRHHFFRCVCVCVCVLLFLSLPPSPSSSSSSSLSLSLSLSRSLSLSLSRPH